MSNNALALLNINLPANLGALAAFVESDDLSDGVRGGFPVMSIRGAKWRISEGGEEKPIYIPGTNDLAPSIKVVLLKANPNISKIFYEGAYVEGADTPPTCRSDDGVTPAADSAKPQSPNCASCKHNVWGSKISPAGKKIKACGDARRMALLPADDLDFPAILLRIPGASLVDLADYGKQLKKAGVPYQAVVTRLSFDPAASFPKVLFNFDRVLTQEEITRVVQRLDDPSIEDVIAGALPELPAADPAPAPADPAPAPAPAARTRTRAAAQPQAQAAAAAPAAAANVVQMPTNAPAADAGVSLGDDVAADIEAELAGLAL